MKRIADVIEHGEYLNWNKTVQRLLLVYDIFPDIFTFCRELISSALFDRCSDVEATRRRGVSMLIRDGGVVAYKLDPA